MKESTWRNGQSFPDGEEVSKQKHSMLMKRLPNNGWPPGASMWNYIQCCTCTFNRSTSTIANDNNDSNDIAVHVAVYIADSDAVGGSVAFYGPAGVGLHLFVVFHLVSMQCSALSIRATCLTHSRFYVFSTFLLLLLLLLEGGSSIRPECILYDYSIHFYYYRLYSLIYFLLLRTRT